MTVNGKKSFEISPKGFVKTDEIDLSVTSSTSVYVSIYYTEQPQENRAISGNTLSTDPKRSVVGDFTQKNPFQKVSNYIDKIENDPYALKYADALKQYKMRYTLTLEGIDVRTKEAGGTIVAFGDSITEQSHWVTPLQKKVSKDLGAGYSLVNAGISGNRLLKEMANLPRRTQYFGVSGLKRFQHDVFDINTNVEAVIIALGVNDLHQPGTGEQFPITELPAYDAMVAGYERLILQAKKHNSKVYLATITPFVGYAADVKNNEKEALRQKNNQWIRENKDIAGIYDFDKVVADTKDNSKLNQKYDSGDKLHPNEAGGKAMSEIIKVKDFVK